MSLTILGLGTALPPHCIAQQDAAELSVEMCCPTDEEAALMPVLYRQAGVEQRHMALPPDMAKQLLRDLRERSLDSPRPEERGHPRPGTRLRMQFYAEQAGPLAVEAGRQALDDSGVPPREITHLVSVSCTGFSTPGWDVRLVKELDLPATVERTHVGFMGCHGALNGLRLARAFAAADPSARVLLCALELCSLHFFIGWDPKKIVANALFGDGAAALVGGAVPSDGRQWRATASGSCLFPKSEKVMTWTIGDDGFEMTLSSRVPRLIAEHLRPWLEAWLAASGLSLDDVGSWAIHPGGPRILSAVEECLGLSRETTAVSRRVLAEYGNMSSPTVLFLLDRLRRTNAPRPCVALGFGPGLAVEAALFQ